MPELPSRVVSNTTPLIALSVIGHLDVLRALYTEILIPPAVHAEIMAGRIKHAGAIELNHAPWIRVVSLKDTRRASLLVDLDRGEAEAIALALELDASLLLVDERLARRYAQRVGLSISGTLGVLLKAKERGFIAELRPLIQRLLEGRIYLGEDIVRKALSLAGET